MLADLNYSNPNSVLPAYDPNQSYGFFGYRGVMCDNAIRSDNVAMLAECVERDFIDRDSRTMANETMVEHCEKKGAVKCAAMLRERGWN